MLLALGPLQLDTADRTVVVGESPTPPADSVDAIWLRSPTAEQVAQAGTEHRVPIGVSVVDDTALEDLVAAGAVAVECASARAIEVALARSLTLWCPPEQARDALDAGMPPERVVSGPGGGGVVGVTVAGDGPQAWGEVVRAYGAGARVVRTSDPRSVRRVVTVVDRLVAARTSEARAVRP